jgi:outer membrane immunogenic protein
MKKILLSSVALLGFSAVATAADLPSRQAPISAPMIQSVPSFSWTGFYVGLNAGVGFNTGNDSRSFAPGSIVGSEGTDGTLSLNDDDEASFIGGGQIGYNVQFGSVVAGLEADLQYSGFDDRSTAGPGEYTFTPSPGTVGLGLAFAPPSTTIVGGLGQSPEYFATIRGRLGVAFDRVLVFGTGGVAFGFHDSDSSFGLNSDDDETSVGYVVGGGVEYAFTNNFTVKLEGLYVNLGNNNNGGSAVYDIDTNTLALNGNGSGDIEFGLVRAGVNYKF